MAVMIDQEQKARAQRERNLRAVTQLDEYEFTFHAPVNLWVCEKRDGTTYTIDQRGQCSCPDSRFRSQQGLRCKHSVQLAIFRTLNPDIQPE